MHKQRGLSLVTLILVAALVGSVLVLGLKLMPAYTEYFGLKAAIKKLAVEQAGAPPQEIREAFYKRATIENIQSVQPDDLEITQDQSGTTIAVKYQKVIPLVANISLMVDFQTSANQANK